RTRGTPSAAHRCRNAGCPNVKEVMYKLGIDDSAKLGKAALKPYGIVAFELDAAPGVGQADGGLNAGRYLTLGSGPGLSGSNASLTLPGTVRLSMGDYDA